MTKNIIFDFGDIFINLDKQAPLREMAKFGLHHLTPELDTIFKDYEMGLMESIVFLDTLQSFFNDASIEQIKSTWNSIILDFPEERLKFIEKLKNENTYRLFLLSNTNDLHMEIAKEKMGLERFKRFQNCFEKFYLSHEMKMRKPNSNIYQFVLNENNLKASETLFIDDTKENTDSASQLGIRCWNLQVGIEDVRHTQKHL
ncbi:HAD-IA family hydrolase [Maribacter sp. ACAM166]|uniref:HAD-IA family hydrolase n=1 Tax=Maribacter sp. ACAM166 TaxID=2508996 RepID=UPI0010FE133D|nr:HAD-IA family hydrolase [Maribacter sp. ACAM166]TLP81264.1 HAD family phosphatase [Maribacter sp. ACAM166]